MPMLDQGYHSPAIDAGHHDSQWDPTPGLKIRTS
jgi:hypothetical protein